MARAIVPSNRNSGIPCPEFAPTRLESIVDIEDIPFDVSHVPAQPDPLLALADELIADDGLTPLEAQSQAVALLDDLDAFAAVWDAAAFFAGNPTVYSDASIPVIQPEHQPIAA